MGSLINTPSHVKKQPTNLRNTQINYYSSITLQNSAPKFKRVTVIVYINLTTVLYNNELVFERSENA